MKEVGDSLTHTSPIKVTVVKGREQGIHLSNPFKLLLSVNNLLRFTKLGIRACVAGFNGFDFLKTSSLDCNSCDSIQVHHDTSYQTVFDSAKLFIYIAGRADIPIIIDTGASISPANNVETNFESPVPYTVMAADNSTEDYTVTVTVTAPSDRPSIDGVVAPVLHK